MMTASKRLVLKVGTGILTTPEGDMLDAGQFARLSAEIAELIRAGHECIVVTSGAVAAGLAAMGFKERPVELAAIQACAAVGQTKLMEQYQANFHSHGLNVAQLLLTYDDLDSRVRSRNARVTIDRLLEAGNVVPIINENDSVAVEELKFGDNDRLSAEVALLVCAELLLVLTSVDGLLDTHGEVVALVDDLDRVSGFAEDRKGRFSVGGMVSKLQAMRIAADGGIPAVILNGRTPGLPARAVAGENVGTRFFPKQTRDAMAREAALATAAQR
jgi:glutamate 5-kinase